MTSMLIIYNRTPVVAATLNSSTHQFEVSEIKPRTRSKFDFSANNDNYNSWTSEAQNWGEASNEEEINSWGQSQYEDSAVETDRYSKKEPETFKLNFDISEEPVFTKVTDYNTFRSTEIIPEYEDIMCPEDYDENRDYRDPLPDIPINRIKSPYNSVDEYLYTQHELMRHDFLIPLQRAVKAYKKSHSISTERKALDNTLDMGIMMENMSIGQQPFRLYEHIHLNAIVFGSKYPLYRISFRLPYYVRVTWSQSKRLIPGTLVLLSKDHFETDLKIATIVERGDTPPNGPNRFEYLLDLYLEKDNDDQPFGFGDPTMIEDDTYVMIEATDGYFEAYRHVLKVIKDIKPDELPFKEYLTGVSNEIQMPHYASRKRLYDINVQEKGRNHERWPVDILGNWPNYKTGMDKTQLDALKTMLTHNLSIVQGPPGTGKTFVGTYAMRVLLHNYDTSSLRPIICICQTNHALDQFLEHVWRYDQNIVRVGGRSKSDILKDRTLYELKMEYEKPRGMRNLFRQKDSLIIEIKKKLIELYEEPCVTLDYIIRNKLLNPQQIACLKRVAEAEKERKDRVSDSKSDRLLDNDDWEISPDLSEIPKALKKTSQMNKGRKTPSTPQKKGRNNLDWAGGNPNRITEVKEKLLNPVEAWLREAIEYVEGERNLTASDQEKEDILNANKGSGFDDPEDTELIEEEEYNELAGNFKGEDDSTFKFEFINIGRAYKRKTEPEPGEPTGRKVVNYNKISRKIPKTTTFSFFEESDEEKDEEKDAYHGLKEWINQNDVYRWPLSARLQAHKKWITERNKNIEADIRNLMKRYVQTTAELRKVTTNFEAKICRENRVVGMTSTAAAKYHDLLEAIRPQILVVEEAAEMLESHIVSALTTSLEHLVLIGDHQQLRPSTSVHELGDLHSMAVSLFERLVMNSFPFTRLSHQRRMRPEIRMLINPIYKDPPLQDHPDVSLYPPVRGMDQSLYFLSHNEPENHLPDSASKYNEHEAKMAAKLAIYLLKQGYKTSDITIITMYSGQKTMIKRALSDERSPNFDSTEIQISSVDGFQGEENKIIILSLVRSNSSGQIGFLKVANRVCVGLSRAKHGMYILGNASLLCEKSVLWNEIVANIEDHSDKMIGSKLVLKCSRHCATTKIQWPVDFSEVEEGGCTLPCNETLPCGHKCELKCHPYDHEEVLCRRPCEKELPCRHPCTGKCFENCRECQFIVSAKLPCQHIITDMCHKIRKAAINPAGKVCPECKRPIGS
ncbi:RNA helicase [Pilobolus umbonatus]|nr:RNA helicase [Pilobolus umbonatus]